MKVAICCPGPSLPKTWKGRDGYEIVWAVNRALLVVDCDWLSAGDLPMFKGLAGDFRPRVGVLTFRDTANETKWQETWKHLQFSTWEESAMIAAHKTVRPINWSVQAALCQAVDVGAKKIDLFGCDGIHGGGPVDCTGYHGEDRTIERWKREEDDLSATFAVLASHGVTITRIAPHGT